MMQVRVLFFAVLRDLVGASEGQVTVPAEGATVASLRPLLEAQLPALAGRLGAVRIARNERFAREDEPIEAGDVIALIPPVAGG